MLVKKNKLFFLGLFLINLIISVVAYFVLPEKFFNDALIISLDKNHEIGLIGSYPFSILFYKITGLKFLPYPIIALIQYPILAYILYKIGVPSDFHKLNVKNSLVYLAFFMMAIFISMPSKEFITFTYLSLIPFVFQSEGIKQKYKIIISMLLLMFLGSFFRIYFLLIPIIAVGMYFISLIKFKRRALTSIFYGLVIVIFLSLSFGIFKGEYLSQPRDKLNTERMHSKDANSMINPPLKPDTWYGETVSIVYGFFSVNLPVEGFKHLFLPQIIGFIIWQLLLLYIIIVRLSRCLANRGQHKNLLWVLFILISYFIVQGVFEPDLGSAIRHKIGVFPLIYFALYYEHFRK